MCDEPNPIPNPHDALIKHTFGHAEHAEGELRAVLPAALVKAIDWSTLSVESGVPVNDQLRARHIDLLYRVELRGHPTYLYTVFEAQRTIDKTMPLRLLVYMSRIWDGWLRHRGESNETPSWPPPPIIPIVLYHGKGRWNRSRQFSEMFELDIESIRALAPYLPRFKFVLDDLTVVPDQILLDRTLTSLGRLVLGVLKHGMDHDLDAEFFLAWQEPIRQLLARMKGRGELATIVCYLSNVNPAIELDTLGEMMMENFGQEAEDVVMTAGQRLRAEGRLEGHRKGRQEGRQEGQVRLLLKLLERRFGTLPTKTTAVVQAANSQSIDRWAERLLDVESLDELFAV